MSDLELNDLKSARRNLQVDVMDAILTGAWKSGKKASEEEKKACQWPTT